MLPSAVSVSGGFDADNVDVRGALSSGAITAAGLKAGRWDGAAVAIFMNDWTAPGAERRLHVARGTLGEVSMVGEGFTAELKGPTAALDAPVVEQTSPECRAMLGDKRCRVDLGGRVRMARVTGLVGETGVAVDAVEPSTNAYGHGRLRWIGGRNSGLASDVRASTGQELVLREAPVFAPAAGDLVELSEGCDRRFETCVARFGNGVNFRGEPHLPGMDLLTRY
jgi:uncharacterized phage protein (TIGR02218 family)